jgi:hypothetical protein
MVGFSICRIANWPIVRLPRWQLVLVLAEFFSGWGKEGDWGDLKFMYEYDPYIEKIAIVGDAKWRDLSYAFTARGLRPIPIEYFEADQEAAARRWLDST